MHRKKCKSIIQLKLYSNSLYTVLKMVRCAVAEESLLPYLKNLAAPNTCTVGLMLGQPTPTKDYIVHFARTPECHNLSNDRALTDITDIQDIWVVDHAKQVTRLLSGGMYVLGIFIVSQNDLLTPFSAKIKSILSNIHDQLGANIFLHGNSSLSTEKLVLNYCVKTHSYSCKTYDVALSTTKPLDFKFQAKPTEWHFLQCKYEMMQVFPIIDHDIHLTLKRHMTNILQKVDANIKSAIFSFDGVIRDETEEVGSINTNDQKDDSIEVTAYLPYDSDDITEPVDIRYCIGQIKLVGHVVCNLWLHSKATIEMAITAITEDLLRSLAVRLEMHWDSLTEEELGAEDANSIHEPPRRVQVNLPNSEITVSDYLFPGEGPQEAQESLRDLLDITLTDMDTIEDIEGQADLVDVYNDSLEAENHERMLRDAADTNTIMYIVGLTFAFLVLIISLMIHVLDIHF